MKDGAPKLYSNLINNFTVVYYTTAYSRFVVLSLDQYVTVLRNTSVNISESPYIERNRLEQMVGVMLDLKRRINSEIVMRSTYQSRGSHTI